MISPSTSPAGQRKRRYESFVFSLCHLSVSLARGRILFLLFLPLRHSLKKRRVIVIGRTVALKITKKSFGGIRRGGVALAIGLKWCHGTIMNKDTCTLVTRCGTCAVLAMHR